MSNSSEDNDSGAEEATLNGDELNGGQVTPTQSSNENGLPPAGGRIAELLQEERQGASTPPQLGNGINPYKAFQQIESPSEDGSLDDLPRRSESPVDSMLSVPDDSPSVQVSQTARSLSFTDMIPRARFFLHQVEAVYCHQLLQDLDLKAPPLLFDLLTDDFNPASRVPPSPPPAHLHLHTSKDIAEPPLSLANSYLIPEMPTVPLPPGKLYDGRS
jgi:hypothetical protein